MAKAIEAYIAGNPVSARNLLKLLATDGFADLPNARTLQRFVADLEARKAVLFTALRDPDGYKSAYRPALGRMDATVSYAHEMWEIDTTKADVMCTDGRKAVLGIIDRWSRRARFLVESESAQSVRRMLVSTILAWGVMPAILKTDNGSGFINKTMETALPYLGIVLDLCLPGTPEDKPHVERLFGTFMRERASLLPGFIGHNVAQAQKLRARPRSKPAGPKLWPGSAVPNCRYWMHGLMAIPPAHP
jgi:transposase InsO family protein